MRELCNRVKKRAAAILLTVCMLSVMTGCGQKAADTALDAGNSGSAMSMLGENSISYDNMDANASESTPQEEIGAAGEGSAEQIDESAAQTSGRKLIKTVELFVETKEFDQAVSALQNQAKRLGGYVESMNTYNGSSYSYSENIRNASMTLRIPETELENFLNTVSDICNVVNRTENVEDVTLNYVDIESHRDALLTEQERLLELLERAETIEDIIVIEERLSNVRYMLESMESQLRTYDNKIDYSTVYLSIDEVRELTPVVQEELTVWERISEGFMDSLVSVGKGIGNFFIWIAVHIPYLVVWAVVIALVVLVIRLICHSSRKRGDARRLQQMVQMQQISRNQQMPQTMQMQQISQPVQETQAKQASQAEQKTQDPETQEKR